MRTEGPLASGAGAENGEEHLPGERTERMGGAERREKILIAAWDALTQVGFEKITTRRIAEAAGINIATLHYHFGSKEAVLVETLRYAQRWAEQRMREAIVGAKTPTEVLMRAFDETWELVHTRPGVLRFDLAVRGFRDPEARQEAESVYANYRRFVREIIEHHVAVGGTLDADLTPETLANYIVSAIDGIVLHHTLSGDEAAAKRNLSLVRRQVFELMGISAVGTENRIDFHDDANGT